MRSDQRRREERGEEEKKRGEDLHCQEGEGTVRRGPLLSSSPLASTRA
jgi:hypothetical protein